MRVRLEELRAADRAGHGAELVSPRGEPEPHMLDSDRLASAWRTVRSRRQLANTSEPDQPTRTRDSFQLTLDSAAECNAHRDYAPRAGRPGRCWGAVTDCQKFAAEALEKGRLDVAQAFDRALLSLAATWRLFDVGIGAQTSLDQSAAPNDIELRLTQAAFGSVGLIETLRRINPQGSRDRGSRHVGAFGDAPVRLVLALEPEDLHALLNARVRVPVPITRDPFDHSRRERIRGTHRCSPE